MSVSFEQPRILNIFRYYCFRCWLRRWGNKGGSPLTCWNGFNVKTAVDTRRWSAETNKNIRCRTYSAAGSVCAPWPRVNWPQMLFAPCCFTLRSFFFPHPLLKTRSKKMCATCVRLSCVWKLAASSVAPGLIGYWRRQNIVLFTLPFLKNKNEEKGTKTGSCNLCMSVVYVRFNDFS